MIQKPFDRIDKADIAVKHSKECSRAAMTLRHLPEDQLEAMLK